MILLHGGITYEMLGLMGGGILFFIIVLVLLHVLSKRTKFYRNDFLSMTTPAKVICYCMFLLVSGFLSSVITLIAAIIVARWMR